MKITGLLNISTKYFEVEIGYSKDQESHTVIGVVAYPFIGVAFQVWRFVVAIDINYMTAGKDLLKYLNNLAKK